MPVETERSLVNIDQVLKNSDGRQCDSGLSRNQGIPHSFSLDPPLPRPSVSRKNERVKSLGLWIWGRVLQSNIEELVACAAGRTPPPGSSEGGAPPSWGFYKGAGPPVGVCEAGSRAEPTTGGRHT